MAGKLNFSLVAPEREVFAGSVDQVDAPGVEGDFGVLPGHAPFMTTLREGVVTVDQAGKENIVLVSAKAAAGYPNNIGDAQWFESLPAFTIPLPEYRNATFSGFQVDGDSMTPALQSLIDGFFSGDAMLEASKALESDCIQLRAMLCQAEACLTRRTEALERARALIDAQQQRIAQLENRAIAGID